MYLLALGISVIAGLRSMTAAAAFAWAAHLNRLVLHGTRLSFWGSPATVGILTLMATGEPVADKLPSTRSGTSAVPLLGRVLTGGVCGAAICAGRGGSVGIGAAVGALGGVAGASGGYSVRHWLVSSMKLQDGAVAEDLIAIPGGLLLVCGF